MRFQTDRINTDLDLIIAAARAIKNQLPDLDLIAHEKQTNDEPHVTTSNQNYYLDQVGQPDAKRVLRRIDRTVARVRRELTAETAAMFALFAGPGADTTLRGTTINQRAFEEAKQAQGRRRDNPNDYVPARIEEQPKYPGRGKK